MKEETKRGFIAIAFIATFVVGMFVGGVYITPFIVEKTAMDALKGNNPYSMEVIQKTHIIDNKDTLFSVDTLFVKKTKVVKV